MTADMHVEGRGTGAQHMIVHGGNLKPAFNQLQHDWIDLGLQQHEIAHCHHPAMGWLERDPAAERERRFDRNAVERDREVGARESVAVYVAGHRRFSAHGIIDLLPVDVLRPCRCTE